MDDKYIQRLQFKFSKGALLALALVVPSLGDDEVTPVIDLEEFRVSASPLGRTVDDYAVPVEILRGAELASARASSIGESLLSLPGLSSTNYFPGASRPVIRGFSNDRIRVLADGMDLLDASIGSSDHAVAIEPYRVSAIEVIRGPAALVHGGSAIGGLVNIIDNRIPSARGTSPLESWAGLALDSAANGGRTVSFTSLASGQDWVFRGGGLLRRHDDLRIPGRAARDPELAMEQPHGLLENSFVNTGEITLGLSRIHASGYFGASGMFFSTRYGLGREVEQSALGVAPDGTLLVERELEDEVTIDAEQWRWDGRARWESTGRWWRFADLRLGISRYEHSELEDGEVGTTFRNQGFEIRHDIALEPMGLLEGALGWQLSRNRFSATGGEAFLRPTTTTNAALFFYEEIEVEKTTWQLGLRYEHRRIRPKAYERDSITGVDTVPAAFRGHALSASASWIHRLDEQNRVSLSLGRTQRLPNAQELFADGPHVGTFAYEVSSHLRDNVRFRREEAWSLDAGWRMDQERWSMRLDLFGHEFPRYFSLRRTGELAFENEDQTFTIVSADSVTEEFLSDRSAAGEENEFIDVTRYVQSKARYYGGEMGWEYRFWSHGTGPEQGSLALDLGTEWVRASDRSAGQPLPRIPPQRHSAALLYRSPGWLSSLRVQWVEAQNRIAPFETTTPGFTWVSLDFWRAFPSGISIGLRLDNLLDEEARSATSFVRDLAPRSGRSGRLTVEYAF